MAKKAMRFAAWVRVSTDRQEAKGGSLDDQRGQIARAVDTVGGTIVAEYGGSEHATPAWERGELDRLLMDAEDGRFDAVMVLDDLRWSRDLVTRRQADSVLQRAGVRMFKLTTEIRFDDDEMRLSRDITSAAGEYEARKKRRRSLEVRINNAKKGWPSCGKIPFGRTWDRDNKTWGVDPEKKAIAEDVAKRYLAGESFEKLAEEYGYHPRTFHKTITRLTGGVFRQRFKDESLGIDETIHSPCPALLTDDVIARLQERAKRNRKIQGNERKFSYLLSGFVRCGVCGYTLTGQTEKSDVRYRYYRHARRDGAKACPIRPRPWVRADALEYSVLRELLPVVNKHDLIERAVRDMVPNADEVKQLEKHRAALIEDERRKARNVQRVLDFVVDDRITQADADAKLDRLKRDRDAIAAKLADVGARLEIVTTTEDVKAAAKATAKKLRKYRSFGDPTSIAPDDARALIEDVFNGPPIGGRIPGVYVFRDDREQMHFELVAGVAIGRGGYVEPFDIEDQLGPDDHVGTDAPTRSATPSPTATPV